MAKRTNLKSDWNNFQEAAPAVAGKTYKEAYNNVVSKAFSGNCSINPTQFLSYVKTKRCENIRAAPLHENKTIVISNTEKACFLNNQLCRVFTKEDFRILKLRLPFSPEIPEINFDNKGVNR